MAKMVETLVFISFNEYKVLFCQAALMVLKWFLFNGKSSSFITAKLQKELIFLVYIYPKTLVCNLTGKYLIKYLLNWKRRILLMFRVFKIFQGLQN